jgi:hypothetical protein
MCYESFQFWSILFWVQEADCPWMGIAFPDFGKFSAINLLNMIFIPLACTSSPA